MSKIILLLPIALFVSSCGNTNKFLGAGVGAGGGAYACRNIGHGTRNKLIMAGCSLGGGLLGGLLGNSLDNGNNASDGVDELRAQMQRQQMNQPYGPPWYQPPQAYAYGMPQYVIPVPQVIYVRPQPQVIYQVLPY